MPIVVTCPECDAKIKAPEHAIGKQIKCPKCSGRFTATANTGAAPTPPPAPPPPAAPPSLDQDTIQDTIREESSGFGDVEVPPVKIPVKPVSKGSDDFDDMPMPSRKMRGPATFGDYLTFKAFITPSFGIQVVFWVLVAYALYFGFELLQLGINVMDHSFGQGVKVIGLALAQIVLSPIFIRVMCETITVLFRINESVAVQDERQEIRRKL